MIMSVVRLAVGMVPVTLLALAFFGFNLWGLGLALAAFFANLILTSWAIGILVSGLILRYGMSAESLAWTIMFIFLPLTTLWYSVVQNWYGGQWDVIPIIGMVIAMVIDISPITARRRPIVEEV